MKKTYSLILIFLSIALFKVYAQNLNNTYWSIHDNSGALISYTYFGTDTLYFSQDNINYSPTSIITINGNQIDISDLPSSTNCQVSDTGIYNFIVQDDTLKFSLINDPCIARSNGIINNVGVRMYVGMNGKNSPSLIRVFPNPINIMTTIDLGKVYQNVDINIHDINGSLVKSVRVLNTRKIDLYRENLKSGVYFLNVRVDGKNNVKRVLVN